MPTTYRFGRLELRPATRQLIVDGQPAALGTRAFDLLVALVERRERLVTKDELFDIVWPGLVVEENNLQVQVSALRKVLGPDAIATVAGHGYRFTLDTVEADAPRPSPSQAAKHNLPTPVASIIGRERELVELRALTSLHRLVTITGVGGIGKTRLALELAASMNDVHVDGMWFVDLAPLSDPSHVANTVASLLGVPEVPGTPVIASLRRFVHDRALLLVLDNCEHLLPACAQLAEELVQAGPRTTVIATSREPLHTAGEVVYSLATLGAPDPHSELSLDTLAEYAAVRLFVERAVATRPDFALTRKNAAAIARICSELDGIPLALELAAARTRSLSPEAIVAHLGDRFKLLKGGHRTALPRQQTLRAMIDWSYELLMPRERTLLNRLSVFAGGFALDAAEAVGADDNAPAVDTLEALDHLVDKSLVAFDPRGERYKLLETVRQYALERLVESGDEASTRDRHFTFHVAMAERARPEMYAERQAYWRDRLNAERENIVLAFAHARLAPGGGPAALRLIYGLSQWLGWGHVELWRRVTQEALALPDAQEETIGRCRALYIASQPTYLTGHYEEAFALAQSSVRIARACGDPLELAEALYRVGITAVAVDRAAEALELLAEGLTIARQLGNREVIDSLSGGLGELYSGLDQFDLAEPLYLESLALGAGSPENTIIALSNLARNAIATRAESKAVQLMRDSLALASSRCSAQSAQAILTNCAGLAGLHGEWILALRLSGAAYSHREQYGLWGNFVDERFHDREMAGVRKFVDTQTGDAAFAAGRALSYDMALREAEAWVNSLPIAVNETSTSPAG